MRRITRSQLDTWLLLGMAVGLCGCPLLLDDDFSLQPFTLPDGGDTCIGPTCHVPHSNVGGSAGDGGQQTGGSAGSETSGGAGGSSSGAAGNSGDGGVGNSGGSAGEGSSGASSTPDAGSSGSAGTGSAGTGSAGTGSAGATGNEEEACRTLELTDDSHDSSSNCLGIAGTNIIVTDSSTSLTRSYTDGNPCFTGTIASAPDWGATFEMELAPGTGSWNASAEGVTGFEFTFLGGPLPPSMRIIYKQVGSSTDYCRTITPGTNEVPFSAAHPSCTSTGTVVNAAQLDELILAILPQSGSSYSVNFCVQIRALD